MQCQRKSLPAQILFKVDYGKLALPVSDIAMNSRFFSFVKSERNLYFFCVSKTVAIPENSFHCDSFFSFFLLFFGPRLLEM